MQISSPPPVIDLEWAKTHLGGFREYCRQVDEVKASEEEYRRKYKNAGDDHGTPKAQRTSQREVY